MNTSFWWAFAAYLIPSFPLGYFWHLKTFRAQYARLDIYRDQVIVPFGLATMILQALIFAWLYPRLFSTARHEWLYSAGAFALVFGLLAWSYAVLPVVAKYKMASIKSFFVLETSFNVLQFLVVSPLIALAWRDVA
jgi:hypothetical protein